MPTRTPMPLAALGVCLVALGCGPTVEGRPGGSSFTTQTQIGQETSDDGSSVFDCDHVEVPTELGFQPGYEGSPSWHWRPLDEQLGDEVLPDSVTVFIASDKVGSYDLSEGDNNTWAKCTHCVRIDLDNVSKSYFQESGTLEVDAGSHPLKGKLESDLRDVRLVEVEIDLESGATTRVEGGDCLEIEDVEITTLVVEDWTCPSAFYGSGDGCDCGCGQKDPDCRNANAGSCEWCGNVGSCAGLNAECPGDIQADDNAVCDVAKAWDCDIGLYDSNGECDCGCGLPDPDCGGDARAAACDSCTASGSCADAAATSCIGVINGANNGECTPFPGWTCDPSYYAAADGCDCGCGVRDPDCSGGDECVYCNNVGSCAEGDVGCDGIDAGDTSQCT